jgi:predicted HTH domain antitoxin
LKTITLEIPEALLWKGGESREAVRRESQFLLALKLFEVGKITSGQAAELSGLNRVDFILAASRDGVPVADLDEEEIAQEASRA